MNGIINTQRFCLIGKMASGKSHVASLLQAQIPSLKKLSFAMPVKKIAKEHFGMQHKDRRLLQIIGGTGRALNPNTWVNQLLQQVTSNGSYVVDDARFPTEIQELKKEGFIIVYVDADDACRITRLKMTYGEHAQQHIDNMHDPSENRLNASDADYVLTNQSDIASLQTQVVSFLRQL